MATTNYPACCAEDFQEPCVEHHEPCTEQAAPSIRENLRRYWREHMVHVAVGATAGWLLTGGYPWAGGAIIATVWVRQSLEFQKCWDTPGIDLCYHLGGLIGGIGAGLLALRWMP